MPRAVLSAGDDRHDHDVGRNRRRLTTTHADLHRVASRGFQMLTQLRFAARGCSPVPSPVAFAAMSSRARSLVAVVALVAVAGLGVSACTQSGTPTAASRSRC